MSFLYQQKISQEALVFFVSLLGSSLCMCIFFSSIGDLGDLTLWAQQSKEVQTTNPHIFYTLDAYQHPGGPIIEGTIAVHTITGSSYDAAISIFLAVSCSILIAYICLLCFRVQQDVLCCGTVFAVLALGPSYNQSTPPSLLASLLSVAFILVTLYLCSNTAFTHKYMCILWSLFAGALIATRIDIGSVLVLGAYILLWVTYRNWKLSLLLVCGSLIAFIAFDPFMWFTPINQLYELVAAMLGHYRGQTDQYFSIPIIDTLQSCGLVLIAMLFSLTLLFAHKRIRPVFPNKFVLFLLSVSTLTGIVVLSAHLQAIRYLQPIIFIWEVCFALQLFSLTKQMTVSFVKMSKTQQDIRSIIRAVIFCLFVLPPLYTFIHAHAVSIVGSEFDV